MELLHLLGQSCVVNTVWTNKINQFYDCIATIDARKEHENFLKNEHKLDFLFLQCFNIMANPNKNIITNHFNYKLSNKFVLSHRLNFCLPLDNMQRENFLPSSRYDCTNCSIMYPIFLHQAFALKAGLSNLVHAIVALQSMLVTPSI